MLITDSFTRISLLGFLAAGLNVLRCNTQEAPPRPQGPPEVAVATMSPEPIELITELPGRVWPYLVAEVRPQVSGIIQKRLFEEGSDVRAGDVLYQIDAAPYEAAYSRAKAALAAAEANLPAVKARVERYKNALAERAVSRQDYDEAVAALEQARATIELRRAEVESARIDLSYTPIKAPISGRIGKSNITVGALVTAHQPTPLATIQQIDPIYVDVTQSTAELLRLKQGMETGRLSKDDENQRRVRLRLEDGTPYPLDGTLQFRDVTVDPSTGSFILRIVFPNPEHLLLPGMFVRALVREGIVQNAILVPQQAVSRDHKGNPVALIVDAEGKVQQKTLAADRAIGNKWLVSSGLEPGDRVIVEGLQKVRPGMPVKTVPFDAGQNDGLAEQGVQSAPSAN
ncbi:MAG TPA: efflux RND transporter periplasmic adaptor subunit [Phycisphaerae bacterium]|nr:efflux RND transporter periplasmic adaptor subunit [Phycisphaerae bacterium]HRR85074.1 efflux RND transporter periplasmic adaptor subunit [Phycisphaerae bacterium]